MKKLAGCLFLLTSTVLVCANAKTMECTKNGIERTITIEGDNLRVKSKILATGQSGEGQYDLQNLPETMSYSENENILSHIQGSRILVFNFNSCKTGEGRVIQGFAGPVLPDLNNVANTDCECK